MPTHKLGNTKRIIPLTMTSEENAAIADRMNRAHGLLRRYEKAATAFKPFIALCKGEGKKLRAIEDECNDITSAGARKAECDCEVFLNLQPGFPDEDRVVVMRTDPGHEGEVLSSTPLSAQQRAELERGVLPGFEGEPLLTAALVPELRTDPAVEAWRQEDAESEMVASRVLGESATQIAAVLDQIDVLSKLYAIPEKEAKPRGRPRKKEQMALPMETRVSSAPTTPTPSPSAFNNRPAVVHEEPEMATPSSGSRVAADESPWNGLPSEPSEDAPVSEHSPVSEKAAEGAPPDESADEPVVVPVSTKEAEPVIEEDETPPPTSRSAEVVPPIESAPEALGVRLMRTAEEAKRMREAVEAAKVVPTPEASDVEGLAALGLTETFTAALTSMLTKKIEGAGSIKTSELEGMVRAKLKNSLKEEQIKAIPYVLRIASVTSPIEATTVDGEAGWMSKEAVKE